MLKQDQAGFIQGNQVIRLQSAEGGRYNNQFARLSERCLVTSPHTRPEMQKTVSCHDVIKLHRGTSDESMSKTNRNIFKLAH